MIQDNQHSKDLKELIPLFYFIPAMAALQKGKGYWGSIQQPAKTWTFSDSVKHSSHLDSKKKKHRGLTKKAK